MSDVSGWAGFQYFVLILSPAEALLGSTATRKKIFRETSISPFLLPCRWEQCSVSALGWLSSIKNLVLG